MNVTINVDETKFKDVIEKELNAFSHEELHDIIAEALKTYLNDNNEIKDLFIHKSNYGYHTTKEATPLLKNLIETIDLSKELEDIKNVFVDSIINNAKEIVTGLFAKAISRSIIQDCANEPWLGTLVETYTRATVTDILNKQ